MGERTKIEWCERTKSPWGGCQAVSPGCDHCYAEALDKRFGRADDWGPDGARRPRSQAYWNEYFRWNKEAQEAGKRISVFPSMCDPFDSHRSISPEWRCQFWRTLSGTPFLHHLLLTKRPQNILDMLPFDWLSQGNGYSNVAIGVTVENQIEANRRIPLLLDVPCRSRFVSCEPLLSEIRLDRVCLLAKVAGSARAGIHINVLGGRYCESGLPYIGSWDVGGPAPVSAPPKLIDWVIAGGESGNQARPTDQSWAKSLRDQCAASFTPFFWKQWGEHDQDGNRVGKARAGRLLDGLEHNALWFGDS